MQRISAILIQRINLKLKSLVGLMTKNQHPPVSLLAKSLRIKIALNLLHFEKLDRQGLNQKNPVVILGLLDLHQVITQTGSPIWTPKLEDSPSLILDNLQWGMHPHTQLIYHNFLAHSAKHGVKQGGVRRNGLYLIAVVHKM